MSQSTNTVGHHEINQLIKDGHDAQVRMRDMVQQVREGKIGQSGIIDQELKNPSGPPREVWDIMKQERNAMLSALLEESWSGFQQEADMSPTRLVEYWSDKRKIVTPDILRSRGDTLAAITNSQRNMTAGTTNIWRRHRDAEHAKEADDPMARAYRRMDDMNTFAAEYGIHCEDTGFYLQNGFNGALQIGHGVAGAIPQVFRNTHQRTITPDEHVAILQKSYRRFFVRPAYLDKTVGIPLMNAPFKPPMNSDAGGFVIDPLQLKLEEEELMPAVERIPAHIAEQSRKTQIGCVALFARDVRSNQNVNRAFFDHYTGIVVKEYIRA